MLKKGQDTCCNNSHKNYTTNAKQKSYLTLQYKALKLKLKHNAKK